MGPRAVATGEVRHRRAEPVDNGIPRTNHRPRRGAEDNTPEVADLRPTSVKLLQADADMAINIP